jgi:hypothetical protein
MPRTNMEEGQHKKLILPGKRPYKVTKVFKESNTVQVMTTQGQHQTANLKNVRKYLPEWMKNDHNEPTEEPETPIETVDHTDKDEGTTTNK